MIKNHQIRYFLDIYHSGDLGKKLFITVLFMLFIVFMLFKTTENERAFTKAQYSCREQGYNNPITYPTKKHPDELIRCTTPYIVINNNTTNHQKQKPYATQEETP